MALESYRVRKFGFPLTTDPLRVSNDQGRISVMEDDGTLITRPNFLDLSATSFAFRPVQSSYSVVRTSTPFETLAGEIVQQLEDDDSMEVQLPFPFTFFGRAYTSVFLNTDGNLTFGQSDSASTERDLQRMAAGPPRISPLLDDLNPRGTARITVAKTGDRISFNWINVGEWVTGGARGSNTFQVVLQADGEIRFSYQSVDALQAVVGLAPGRSLGPIDLIDLSAQTTTASFSGVIAEVFALTESVSLAAVSQYFYRSHPDSYDFLMVFSDFSLTLSNAFAFTIAIRNDVRGIIRDSEPLYDVGRQFGSAQRLQAMSNMGSLNNYPTDPRTQFLGQNNTLSIVSHEFGHRWLSFVDTNDEILLGRQRAHWSFFHNTSGSVMEGNEIVEVSPGRFRTVDAVKRYSPLDQYLMGLRPASEVPPWFVVTSPTFDSLPSGFSNGCRESSLAACSPYVGLEFRGTRRDVTIDEIVRDMGPRIPASGSAPKTFRVAFILLTQKGQAPRPGSVARLDAMRSAWETAFSNAVEGRGAIETDLLQIQPPASTVDVAIPENAAQRLETVTDVETSTRVGYAGIDAANGVVIYRSFANGTLQSEAAVPASSPGTSFLMFAENSPSTGTGVAMVNPGTTAATVSIRLGNGPESTITLPAGAQLSRFINELLPTPILFEGPASIRSSVPIAITVLRGTASPGGAFLVSPVPYSNATPSDSSVTVTPYPTTQMVLLNPSTSAITGRVEYSDGNRTPYDIPAGGAVRISTPPAATYAAVVPDPGMIRPVSSAMLPVTNALMLATDRSILTIVNRSSQVLGGRLTAYDDRGVAVAETTLTLTAQRTASLKDLLPALPSGFIGTVRLESSAPVYAATLRGTLPLPTIDLSSPPTTRTYFPQLADGGTFTTEMFLMSTSSFSSKLQFFDTAGRPLFLRLQR